VKKLRKAKNASAKTNTAAATTTTERPSVTKASYRR